MEREKQQCMWHKTRQWIVNEFMSSRKKCTDLSTETLSGEIEDCRQCSRERERERERFHVFYSISNHTDGSIVLGFISCEAAVTNIFERVVQPLQLLQVKPRPNSGLKTRFNEAQKKSNECHCSHWIFALITLVGSTMQGYNKHVKRGVKPAGWL